MRQSRACHFAATFCSLVTSLLVVPAIAAEKSHYPKTLRFDEDYSYLADPALRSDFWDPIKHIGLSNDSRFYVSFGGEWRERYEYSKGYLFSPDPDSVVLHRLMLHGDLHLGDSFRSFVQLSTLGESGRDGGPLATDKNNLDFQQAFIDVSHAFDEDERAIGRVGRQELLYGSGRFVAIREGPNSRRSFDGARAMYRSTGFDLDGFLTRPVTIKSGVFDDKWNEDRAFWGIYGVKRISPSTGIDVYYFGNDYSSSAYSVGVAAENRHTVGTRLWGRNGSFDYNTEAVYQFGSFGPLTISAWALAVDAGWTVAALPFSPRFGIKANIESGDRDPNDGTLGTLNPLFPNHAYFSEAAVGAPMNDIDVQPNILLHLADGLTLSLAYDVFWRYSTNDTVYTAALTPIAGIAGESDRYVGNLVTAHLKWQLDRHVELNFDYTHFNSSNVLKAAGVNDIDFFMASAAYKF